MNARSDITPNRSKPIFPLLLLVIASLAGLLGYDLYKSYEREFEIQRQDAANLTNVIERHIHTYVDKVDVVLIEAVHEYTPVLTGKRKVDVLTANLDLRRREAATPEAQAKSLRVINAEGQVVFSAGSTNEIPDVNVGDRAYFQKQKNTPNSGLVMSEPILSRFTGKWLFTLSRRVSYPDGTFAGLIQTAIRADYFEAGFNALNVGKSGNVSLFSVVDGSTRLMARRPSLPDQLGKIIPITEITSTLSTGIRSSSYRAISRVDGIERQYFFRQFDDIPLVIVVGGSIDEILDGWKSKAWFYGISLLVLTLQVVWIVAYQRRMALQNQRVLEEKILERTQELTQTNEKLESAVLEAQAASLAKSQFLATMSHELRTPLNGIIGMSELLMDEAVAHDEVKEYAGIISTSGHNLLSIVSDILDLSKIESGKIDLHPAPVSVRELLEDTCKLFKVPADDKGLKLHYETDLQGRDHAEIDALRVKQMLGNLVNNAIKFSSRGEITVRARYLPSAEPNEAKLEFSITDQGIGIAEEKLNTLFKPFTQVDGSTTRGYGGTGLGLSIVKKLAELMQGTVGVESRVAHGSRFWFCIKIPD